MFCLTKFSNVPNNKWIHSNYISSLYKLYVLENPYLPSSRGLGGGEGAQKVDLRVRNEYFSRLVGRVVCHMEKHKKALSTCYEYDSNITQCTYYGLFSTIIASWPCIHPKHKLVLLVAVVKILKSFSGNPEERFVPYQESLLALLKFIFICDEEILGRFRALLTGTDDFAIWRSVQSLMAQSIKDFEEGPLHVQKRDIVSLVESLKLNKDFPRLFSLFYWLRKMELSPPYLESPFKAALSGFKSCYREDCDLRDVLNALYYIAMFDPAFLTDPFFVDILGARFKTHIAPLNVLDCYQLLHVIDSALEALEEDVSPKFVHPLFTALVNVDLMLARTFGGGSEDPADHDEADPDLGLNSYSFVHGSGNGVCSDVIAVPRRSPYNNLTYYKDRHLLNDYEFTESLCAHIMGDPAHLANFLSENRSSDRFDQKFCRILNIHSSLLSIAGRVDLLAPYCIELAHKISNFV